MRSIHAVGLSAWVGLMIGCGTDDAELGTVRQKLGAPSEFFSNDGRRFVLAQANSALLTSAASQSNGVSPLAAAKDRRFDKPAEAMDLDEWAEALRPITLIDGHEYRLESPDYDAATLMLQGRAAGGDPYNPRGPANIPVGKSFCCGTDGRAVIRNNESWPYSTTIAMAVPDSGIVDWNAPLHGECTMQLIGPSTATSVAHCFHDSVNWTGTMIWGAGPDALDEPVFPNGFPRAYGCYTAYLPAAWVGSGGNFEYDIAVVDFRGHCQPTPGAIVGWLGWSDYSDATLLSNSGYAYGVPALLPYPQIRGMWTSNATMHVSAFAIDHSADCSDGDSGRGFWQYINAGWRSTANHSRAPIDGQCRDRRLSADVAAFIRANSEF